jgi:hypothetical protein
MTTFPNYWHLTGSRLGHTTPEDAARAAWEHCERSMARTQQTTEEMGRAGREFRERIEQEAFRRAEEAQSNP